MDTCRFGEGLCTEEAVWQLYIADRYEPTKWIACDAHKEESTGIQWEVRSCGEVDA